MIDQNDQQLMQAILRNDFSSFAARCFQLLAPGKRLSMNWHIYALEFVLEQVRAGKIKRLIINAPPRSLKSFITSICFTAFVLGHDATKRIIAISYSADLAANLSNEFRTIMNAAFYRDLFPATKISRSKNTEYELATTRRGFRLATSVEGTLTGRGGDIIIIDDPLQPNDAESDSKRERVNDFFYGTAISRLDDKTTGAIIIVMQRVHVDDLSGSLRRRFRDDWTVLSLPAIAEEEECIHVGDDQYHIRRVGDLLHAERHSLAQLESDRAMMGPAKFAAQYQQAPVPSGGLMIKPEWIERYDSIPERGSSTETVQSWDTANKDGDHNDHSVCSTWMVHENKYYLIHVLRGRFDYPNLKKLAISHARAHKADTILVEDAGIGTALVKELQDVGVSAVAVKPEHNKRTRMAIQSGKMAAGQVFFPREAPWLVELENELFSFPKGLHDDQVDSVSQALAHQNSGYDASFGIRDNERFTFFDRYGPRP
jgi:predicted phage terminase large subunit-like protein